MVIWPWWAFDDAAGIEEPPLEGVGGGRAVSGQAAAQPGADSVGQDGQRDVEVDVERDGAGERGERHCARIWTLHERRHHVARVPGFLSQGLDLVEPVMYLSWTDDVPIVYRPIAAPQETSRMNA
jgi:hypothetical protein